MVRISKDYDERRTELLDAAQSLFYDQGYESTTVDAIIDKVGVAKGTFYYYFDSKVGLLNALADRLSAAGLEEIRRIVELDDMDALAKLNRFFELSRGLKVANKEIIRALLRVVFKDDNILLRHKLNARSISLVSPEMTKIIRQGVEEGIFDTPYPDGAGEMLLLLGKELNEQLAPLILELDEKPANMDRMKEMIAHYENAIERILGAPKGSIMVQDSTFLQELFG